MCAQGADRIDSVAPPAILGQEYTYVLKGSAPQALYTWDLVLGEGTLPAGLSLDAGGKISGTPMSAGSFVVLARGTDEGGSAFTTPVTIQVDSPSISINTVSLAGALLNMAYRQDVTASGGVAPYSFTLVSGGLPPGITVSSIGTLSGTPTLVGNYTFTLQSTDAVSSTAQATYTLVVAISGPRLISTSVPAGTINAAYTTNLAAQGGTAPYTYTLLAGVLPAGVTLSSSGLLSGTPTILGVYPVTVRITDAAGQLSQSDLRIAVNPPGFVVSTTTLPNGSSNTTYSSALGATGGVAPLVYSLLRGSLPPGVTLNSSGLISGLPTLPGTYSFDIQVRDAMGLIAQAPLTLLVERPVLSFVSSGLANGLVGRVYSSTLLVVNGVAPFTYNIVSGSLPAGLALATNGNLSGTPTASGLYQVTYRVLDNQGSAAQRTIPLYIASTGLILNTLSLPSGRPNVAYTTNLAASGGTAPYTYEVSSGVLPAGLTLSPAGVLSGTPTQRSGSAFTVRVRDSLTASSLVSYLLNINDSAISLSSAALSNAQTGQEYTGTLAASGGTGPYTYSIDSGNLPPGLTLQPAGTISGTTSAAGTYTFNLRVTDATQASVLFNQVLLVGAPQLTFITNRVPELVADRPYFAAFSVVNGLAPYAFSIVTGTLPAGITLNANGNLTGTTQTTGDFPVTVRVTDATGAFATVNAVLRVTNGYPFQITTDTLPTGTVGTAYTATIASSAGKEPYTFQLEQGSLLPAGLTLSLGGVITGTPSTTGATTFVVRSRDNNGFVFRRSFTLTVNNAAATPTLTSISL